MISCLKRFTSSLLIVTVLMTFLFSLQSSANYGAVSIGYSNSTSAKKRQVVRVGFTDFEGFSEMDENGNCSGYIYEYLQEIAKYTGWEYEFIPDSLDPSDDLLAKVAAGEVDLIGGIVKNQYTEEIFEFPEMSSGITYAALIVSLSNTKYTESDYQTFHGMRVAYIKTAKQRLANLQQFCTINDIPITTIPYDNYEDVEADLLSGKVDAFLGGDISPLPNTRILTRFSPTTHYFAVGKNNAAILNGLNIAISKIKEININYDMELYSKYFPMYSQTPFFLSEKESEYLQNLPPLRVVSGANSIPVDYFDSEGNFRGITADIFAYISGKTGIKFEFIQAANQKEAYIMTLNGQADIVTNIMQDTRMQTPPFLTTVASYLSVPMVMVKTDKLQSSDLEQATMAVLDGFNLDFNDDTSPKKLYDTTEDCLTAVNQGDADYCYGNTYSVGYYQRALLLDNLTLLSLPQSSADLCFAITKPVDTTLIGIFNKAIHSFEDEEIQRIIFDNTSNLKYDISFPAFLRNNVIAVLWVALFIAASIITFVVWFLQNKRRMEERETQRYRALAELSDEVLFQYDFTKDRFKISEKHASTFCLEPVVEQFYRKLQNGQFYFSVKDFRLFPLQDSVLAKEDLKNSIDFPWKFPDGSEQWFRVVYVIAVSENNHPSSITGKFWNIDKELEEKAHLLSLAQKDTLTCLYNKGATERLASDHFTGTGKDKSHAFFLIDIDNFKFINDNFGHHCGDETLKLVARILSSPFRSMDIVGRIGGDEFVVIMKDIPSKNLVSEKAVDILNSLSMAHELEGHNFRLSCSIGIAFYPDDAASYNELYQKADEALYTVKRHGKMGYQFYKE